jgi:hypothetical protein
MKAAVFLWPNFGGCVRRLIMNSIKFRRPQPLPRTGLVAASINGNTVASIPYTSTAVL